MESVNNYKGEVLWGLFVKMKYKLGDSNPIYDKEHNNHYQLTKKMIHM